jgi:hypothetical protein
METNWPYVKCSWPVLLCSEPFFQPVNWKAESFPVLSLWDVVVSYLYYHIVCKTVITFHTTCSNQSFTFFTLDSV